MCSALNVAGRHDEADEACARSVALGVERFGDDDSVVAKVRYAWGTNLLERGRAEEALPLLRRARDVQRQLYGADHPFVATSTLAIGSAELSRFVMDNVFGITSETERKSSRPPPG